MSLVYLDTSVALAQLLAEDRVPDERLWDESLIASRLLEYELWTRVHARRLGPTHGDLVRELVGRVSLVEVVGPVVQRALEPFPAPVRTLDALHLGTAIFLRAQLRELSIATYDDRMRRVAQALELPLYDV